MMMAKANNELAPLGGPAPALAGQAAPGGNALPPIDPAELWQVMERQIALYTNLDSSSVPEETAMELLGSVLFCVAAAYKEFLLGGGTPFKDTDANTDDASSGATNRTTGLKMPLADWLLAGQRVLTRRHGAGLVLQKKAQAGSLRLNNPMYRDALAGTRQFFIWYDIRFMAHQVPCDIDYPLALPVSEALKGIDYISRYLCQRIWEDAFCRAFPISRVCAVLARHSPDWQILPLNLFEPVFVSALGCALLSGTGSAAGEETQTSAPTLCRTSEERRALWAALHPLTLEQLTAKLAKATTNLCNQLHIWGSAQRAYFAACAATLPPRILAASREGFAHIFL